MQTEQDIIRNFCPYCTEIVNLDKTPTWCETCRTTDLIPTPPQFITDIKYFDSADLNEKLEEPKSKLDLDKNAVNKLLNEDFGYLAGVAGSGKSTLITELDRLYPHLLEIVATTGIASVNLGTKTINSTLKYFDTKSLENAWQEQTLHFNLRLVRSRKQKLLIDEISMMDAEQLNLIVNAVDEINSDNTGKKLGLWITGDFLQLPPIRAKYAFHSDYWDRFANNTVRLTKVWRQDNLEFMRGINLIRENKGIQAMQVLQSCGVNFVDKVDDNFEGTTLIPKNDEVESYNLKRLNQIPGLPIRTMTKIYGKALPEWNKNIPVELRLKIGAYVMILANDIPEFNFVNGDCGIIEGFTKNEEGKEVYSVRLKRNNTLVDIRRIERFNLSDKEPNSSMFTGNFRPYNDYKTGEWVIGKVSYHPLRLAYASTLHKSQGLSLDLVQIDTRHQFFGADSMGYVGISRARTPNGLYLVGKPETIGKKLHINKEVMKYV